MIVPLSKVQLRQDEDGVWIAKSPLLPGCHAHGRDRDEAQRAWNLKQTASFMRRKKKRLGFASSEPEFLISYMDRHKDWAVIVCLVGGGQEINRGEAGIAP